MSESEDSSSSAEVDAKDRKIDSSVGSSEAIDPELDIRSEQFNPLKALYASSIQMPVENTPLFNNLAQYESALKRQDSAISSMVCEKKNAFSLSNIKTFTDNSRVFWKQHLMFEIIIIFVLLSVNDSSAKNAHKSQARRY